VSALADAASDYLRLPSNPGHDPAEHHRGLPRFVAFLEAGACPTVTVAAALAWAHGPDVDPGTSIALGRYAGTRGRLCPQTTMASFFVSTAGTRLIYA
jgi:integrase/recombinase XerD